MTMKAALVMLATLTGAIASPGCASGAAALVGVALCCPPPPLLRALRPILFGVGVICDFFFFFSHRLAQPVLQVCCNTIVEL